jgi:hypothetical protein
MSKNLPAISSTRKKVKVMHSIEEILILSVNTKQPQNFFGW